MNKNENVVLGCFGAVVLFLCALIVSPIINGWVLCILWGWFIVPIFNLPQISIPVAIGMSLIAGRFLQTSYDSKDDKFTMTERVIKIISLIFIAPLTVLLMGYIVHSFM